MGAKAVTKPAEMLEDCVGDVLTDSCFPAEQALAASVPETWLQLFLEETKERDMSSGLSESAFTNSPQFSLVSSILS